MSRSDPSRTSRVQAGGMSPVGRTPGGGAPPEGVDVPAIRGPETPALIHASGARSAKSNRWSLQANEWFQVEIDRASVVAAVSVTDGPLLYNYGQIPVDTRDAQVAERGGTCILGGPGKWWFRYQGTQTIQLLTVDAWHPSVSGKYLGQGGAARAVMGSRDISSNTIAELVVAADRNRIGLIIQSVRLFNANTPAVRVSFDQPTTLLEAGAPNDQGHMLGTGGTMTLGGDTLARGNVYVILEGSGTGTARIVYTAFTNT